MMHWRGREHFSEFDLSLFHLARSLHLLLLDSNYGGLVAEDLVLGAQVSLLLKVSCLLNFTRCRQLEQIGGFFALHFDELIFTKLHRQGLLMPLSLCLEAELQVGERRLRHQDGL